MSLLELTTLQGRNGLEVPAMKNGCTLANVSNMNLNTARGCGANTELIDSLPVQTTTALMLLFQVYFSSYFLLTSEIQFIETL